jgi:formiminotetrahydrofolate cyclodeaminase
VIERPFAELVASLAARTPTPGGGAAGGMAAAMGNALLLMAVRFCRGKKSNQAREGDLATAEQRLLALHAEMLTLAARDCASFEPVAKAYELPRATPQEQATRQAAIELGLLGAMTVPQETLRLVRDALAAAAAVADCAHKTIVSDLAAGGQLLRAAAEIAFLNVRINAALLSTPASQHPALASSQALRDDGARQQAVLQAAADRLLS